MECSLDHFVNVLNGPYVVKGACQLQNGVLIITAFHRHLELPELEKASVVMILAQDHKHRLQLPVLYLHH